MKDTQDISQAIRQLHVPASPELDERVHSEFTKTATTSPATPMASGLTFGQMFARLMKRKSTRYTLATTLGLVLLVVLVLNHSTTSAFAMDQAIEALKKYKAMYITGYITTDGKTTPLEVWARADVTGNLVETGLVNFGDITIWTKDNKTYTYGHAENMVSVAPGITLGLNPWPGPELLNLVATMKDYKAFEGEDPATGRKRVIVTCSLETLAGPQSFLEEFDARTKLLVSFKSWPNLKREGAPYCDFEKIVYFKDLPDSAFNFQPPAGTTFTNLPLTIPESGLSSLADSKSGISAEGMTREQACQKILKQFWTARMKNDLARIRQLWPLTATWPDEFLRDFDDQYKIEQVLKIGSIDRTGHSKLGPLAQVPSWIRYQDGIVRKVWMIVQFRETDQGTSCVIYGPAGYALNVKE